MTLSEAVMTVRAQVDERVEIDRNDALECPYCGYVDRDAWELFTEMGDETHTVSCGACEKDFGATRSVSVMYTSFKEEE